MDERQAFDMVLHAIEIVLAGGIFAITVLVARQVRQAHSERQAAEDEA